MTRQDQASSHQVKWNVNNDKGEATIRTGDDFTFDLLMVRFASMSDELVDSVCDSLSCMSAVDAVD